MAIPLLGRFARERSQDGGSRRRRDEAQRRSPLRNDRDAKIVREDISSI